MIIKDFKIYSSNIFTRILLQTDGIISLKSFKIEASFINVTESRCFTSKINLNLHVKEK